MIVFKHPPHRLARNDESFFSELEKPLIPAYMFVPLSRLPEIITEYQCRRIESSSERENLIGEIDVLCRDRKPLSKYIGAQDESSIGDA